MRKLVFTIIALMAIFTFINAAIMAEEGRAPATGNYELVN